MEKSLGAKKNYFGQMWWQWNFSHAHSNRHASTHTDAQLQINRQQQRTVQTKRASCCFKEQSDQGSVANLRMDLPVRWFALTHYFFRCIWLIRLYRYLFGARLFCLIFHWQKREQQIFALQNMTKCHSLRSRCAPRLEHEREMK